MLPGDGGRSIFATSSLVLLLAAFPLVGLEDLEPGLEFRAGHGAGHALVLSYFRV